MFAAIEKMYKLHSNIEIRLGADSSNMINAQGSKIIAYR